MYLSRLDSTKLPRSGQAVVPPIRNLRPSSSFALNHDVAVPRAQFDLSNMSAGSVNLFGDERRELLASVFFAYRNVAAAMDPKSSGRGIEIGRATRAPLYRAVGRKASSYGDSSPP